MIHPVELSTHTEAIEAVTTQARSRFLGFAICQFLEVGHAFRQQRRFEVLMDHSESSALSTIDIRELPARLDELLALTAAGQEVLLFDGSTARARLVPLPLTERVAGLHAGADQMSRILMLHYQTTSGGDSHEVAPGHPYFHPRLGEMGQRHVKGREQKIESDSRAGRVSCTLRVL